MIINLYKHRGYIWHNAWAELRTQYAGSSLGGLWAILEPLAMIAVYTIVFTTVMGDIRGPRDGIPFAVYLCSGLLPWLALSECMMKGMNAFTSNATYLKKLPIPEQIFVAKSALSSFFNLLIAIVLLLFIAMLLGVGPTWHWLLLPIPLVLMMGLGFGVGLGLGTIMVFIRDLGQIVPVILRVGFWAYPIVYQREDLPDWAQKALPYNPAYPFLETIRSLVLWETIPGPGLWAAMVFWAFIAPVLGYLILRKLRPEIRDVL